MYKKRLRNAANRPRAPASYTILYIRASACNPPALPEIRQGPGQTKKWEGQADGCYFFA